MNNGKSIQSFPPQTPPPGARPHAQVLLIRRFHCRRCGQIHTSPNPSLLYHYIHSFKGSKYSYMHKTGTSYWGIERRIEYTDEKCEACDACFKQFETAGQRELFPKLMEDLPHPLEVNYTIYGYERQEVSALKNVKPTPLSEF